MEARITYFEDFHPENTHVTVRLVQERLKGSDIKKIALASTTGATAQKALEFFKGQDVQSVSRFVVCLARQSLRSACPFERNFR